MDQKTPSRTSRALDIIAPLAAIYVAIMVTVLGGVVVKVIGDNKQIPLEAAYDNRVNDHEACDRSNESRHVTVSNLRDDIEVFRSDVAFGRVVLRIPGIEGTELGDRVHDFITAHQAAIEAKQETIAGYKRVLAPVAVEGHPLRGVCDGQFPIPPSDQRGEELPKPTVP